MLCLSNCYRLDSYVLCLAIRAMCSPCTGCRVFLPSVVCFDVLCCVLACVPAHLLLPAQTATAIVCVLALSGYLGDVGSMVFGDVALRTTGLVNEGGLKPTTCVLLCLG